VPSGRREMLRTALLVERQAYLDAHAHVVDQTGKRLVVGNGYAKERQVTTAPDGRGEGASGRRPPGRPALPFGHPACLYAQVPKVTEVLPVLYLRGLSTGDFALRWASSSARGGTVGLYGEPAHRVLAGRARALGRPDLSGLDYVYWWQTGSTSTSAWRRTGCAAWSSSCPP